MFYHLILCIIISYIHLYVYKYNLYQKNSSFRFNLLSKCDVYITDLIFLLCYLYFNCRKYFSVIKMYNHTVFFYYSELYCFTELT